MRKFGSSKVFIIGGAALLTACTAAAGDANDSSESAFVGGMDAGSASATTCGDEPTNPVCVGPAPSPVQCQSFVCSEGGVWATEPLDDDSPCTNTMTNANGTCQDGACVATPASCTGTAPATTNPCIDIYCDSMSGTFVQNTTIFEGTACVTGQIVGTCTGGTCVQTAPTGPDIGGTPIHINPVPGSGDGDGSTGVGGDPGNPIDPDPNPPIGPMDAGAPSVDSGGGGNNGGNLPVQDAGVPPGPGGTQGPIGALCDNMFSLNECKGRNIGALSAVGTVCASNGPQFPDGTWDCNVTGPVPQKAPAMMVISKIGAIQAQF